MSYGGGAGFNIEAKAMQALNRKGVVMVASAGNDGSQVVQFPAGYDTVLAVGATDINDNAAGFTNFGGWVDVTGPGVSNPTATCEGCVVEALFEEISPTARSFEVRGMTNSALGSALNEEIVFVGTACANEELSSDPSDKIALIARGACSFAEKAMSAQSAGALAAVVRSDDRDGGAIFNGTLGTFASAIPVVSMSRDDGLALEADIAGGVTTASCQPGA